MVSLLKENKSRKRIIDENLRNLILELYWNRNIGIRKIANHAGISTMTVWREVNRTMPEKIYNQLYSCKVR